MLCSVPSPSGCLRATSEFLFLGTRGAAADESEGGSAVRCDPVTTIDQVVCTGVRNLRACTRVSLRPIPQWAALQGCTAVVLMAEHDDARQNDNSRAGSVHGCTQSACLHEVFPTPSSIMKFLMKFLSSLVKFLYEP